MNCITADTGILNANKVDNLLILLRGQFAERLGKSKSIRRPALVRPKQKNSGGGPQMYRGLARNP
jgi:hypothetical protein